MIDSEKRKRVMGRSKALGHCICNPKQPCPCDELKTWNVCHCAGESREVADGPVRLTELVANPGCASKIDQRSLKAVLSGLPGVDDPNVLIGAPAGDDAGVYRIGEDEALVQTVDVFAPSVDDPYTFGQIAAANSVSDVYAMGGRPLTALSVVAYPIRESPPSAMREILKGGIDKMREAGVVVIGGHSINDPEIKAGFAVTGRVRPSEVVTNAGAMPGDVLVLTKPLGTGIVTFAAQIGRDKEEWGKAAAASMAALNKTAAELMRECGAHAATDVTGFGLSGHLSEMARASNVTFEVVWDDIPLLPGVLECVAMGILPGGIERNRESSEASIETGDGVTRKMLDVCFDAQTSGGLLVALPESKAHDYLKRMHDSGVESAVVIGWAIEKGNGRVMVRTNGTRRLPEMNESPRDDQEPQCCAGESTSNAGDGASEVPCCAGAEESAGQSCCAAEATGDETCCPGGASAEVPCRSTDKDAAPSRGVERTEASFREFMRSAASPGALDAATKEALAVGLSILAKCAPCTKAHVAKARKMGFSDEEIDEIAWSAVSFGGSPIMMFYKEFKQNQGR